MPSERATEEKPKSRGIGVGVGRKRSSSGRSFAGEQTLSLAAEQLQEGRDEGEFVSPLPMTSVSPDPNNSRQIIGYLTGIVDEITNKDFNGHRIDSLIKNEEQDLSEIPCEHFFDVDSVVDATGYGPDEVADKWLNALLLARSIHFNKLKQPIEVRRKGDSRNLYIINYGHRRYFASRLIQAKTIRGVIANTDQKQDDLSTAITRWAENRNDENLTFWEEYKDLKSIREGWNQRYGEYPSNRKLAPRLGISRKAVDRIAAVIRAEENGLLTEKFEMAIKNGWIFREHAPLIINQAMEINADRDGVDQILEETMASIGYEVTATETLDPVNGSETKIAEGKVSRAKAERRPSASIKIKDVDFGKRVIKALSTEFKEFGDINADELSSISEIKALLKRLI